MSAAMSTNETYLFSSPNMYVSVCTLWKWCLLYKLM